MRLRIRLLAVAIVIMFCFKYENDIHDVRSKVYNILHEYMCDSMDVSMNRRHIYTSIVCVLYPEHAHYTKILILSRVNFL